MQTTLSLRKWQTFFIIIIINQSRENHHRDTCIVKPIITGHTVFLDKKLNRTEIVTFKRDDDDKITTSTNRSSSVDHQLHASLARPLVPEFLFNVFDIAVTMIGPTMRERYSNKEDRSCKMHNVERANVEIIFCIAKWAKVRTKNSFQLPFYVLEKCTGTCLFVQAKMHCLTTCMLKNNAKYTN